MRESLSLFRGYHWTSSLWTGHYFKLIRWWGIKCMFLDTVRDSPVGVRLRTLIRKPYERVIIRAFERGQINSQQLHELIARIKEV